MPIAQTILLLLLLIIAIITLIIVLKKTNIDNRNDLTIKISSLSADLVRIETSVKGEFAGNRMEAGEGARLSREEAAKSFISFETKLNALTTALENKLSASNESNSANAKDNRAEVKTALDSFKADFSKSISDFTNSQKESFVLLQNKQNEQNSSTALRLDQMRETLEKKITDMQAGNEKKLDEMRTTVDEKLQKTLETRLGESFKLVSERLEAVHKGLGDMQQLATGVGDLKRVLTNVKTRGVMGEYQLESLLEQMLTPDQYAKNVKTKEGSNAMVEFAIKLPGRGDDDRKLWLPIDSKFPKEDYELLMTAYDNVLPEVIEEHRKSFVRGIKKCAGDICGKYIDPPNTTDFAILFLPFESLYAEVLRTPGLFETIQRECKIIITGPTTLSALLSSLQMGFRTLTIEKRSSEVWQLLSGVKTEFKLFGEVLVKTKKKLEEASNVIDSASIRSRAIERKLKDVQELKSEEAPASLSNISLQKMRKTLTRTGVVPEYLSKCHP